MGTLPPKLQDPGAPIILIQIGDFKLDRALLDLGACVSILHGSLYDQYDFGPLQSFETIVVLADQTPMCPRGIAKDVIVKVGEFYYPVDFLVLDYVKNNQPTVILGRPFLATAHAVIHCVEGTVRFRFGDKKSILKVFSNSTKPVANKCEPSEKKSLVEEKECFMIDRLVKVKKKKKKSRRSRRKKRKKLQKIDGEEEKCELNSFWLLNKLDGVSKLWMNRLMKMRDCKHPTRPP
ncbi:putative aspartic peptidase domain superfamily [Helianthus debilis subsp. tardiflorus]